MTNKKLLELRGVYFNSLDQTYDDMMSELDDLENQIAVTNDKRKRVAEHEVYKSKLSNLKTKDA